MTTVIAPEGMVMFKTERYEMQTLPDLADEIVKLEDELNTLTVEKTNVIADKKHELLIRMMQDEISAVNGTLGQTFKVGTNAQYKFTAGAVRWAEDKGIARYFTTEPQVKITKTKMDDLLKKGIVDHEDYAWLENNHCVEITKDPVLKMSANKEA